MDVYENPIPKHTYCMTVDVSEGTDQDYSTFAIIDVTSIPYKVVAKYRDNKITPYVLPTIIYQAARKYNDAFVLVEINTIGLQVADILHFELAYENLIKIEAKGKQGQVQTPGFKKKIAFGLKHNKMTKMIGCTNLKAMIESDKLIIRDPQIVSEFTTFVLTKQTYKAEEGSHDDLAMTLVNFGWLTSQRYFKENINNNIRSVLQQEQMNVMDGDIVPFGVIDNGLDDGVEKDANGDLWFEDLKKRYVFDDLNYDWQSKL
jgi:Terminase RNaseH-like domain